MTALLCGATFQGLQCARQTAPTKRRVYEDFTRTLMRRRENRVWLFEATPRTLRGQKTNASGRGNADERYSYGVVCAVVSLHHSREGCTIRTIRPQVWQRVQAVLGTEGTAPEDQTRRVGTKCRVSKAGTGFQLLPTFCTSCTTGAQCPCLGSVAPTRACRGGQAQDEPPHPKVQACLEMCWRSQSETSSVFLEPWRSGVVTSS